MEHQGFHGPDFERYRALLAAVRKMSPPVSLATGGKRSRGSPKQFGVEILTPFVYLEKAPCFARHIAFRDASMDKNQEPPSFANKEDMALGRAAHTPEWAVDGNHVYPVKDLRKHSIKDCWCRPTEDDGVVVHNSLDGREHYERGDRKIS